MEHILKKQSQGLNFLHLKSFFFISSCLKPKLERSSFLHHHQSFLLLLILVGKDAPLLSFSTLTHRWDVSLVHYKLGPNWPGCCLNPSHSPGSRFLFSIHSARRRINKLTDPPCVSQCHVNMVNFVPPCSIITRPAAICRLSGPAHTSCLISFRSGGAAGSHGLQADDFSEGSRGKQQ